MVKVGASGGVTETKVDPKKKTKVTVTGNAISVVDDGILVEPIESALGPEFAEGWDERADAPDLHDSGKHLFRCSMLGDCMSALVAYALEEQPVEPPDNIRARMDEGKVLERKIIDRALADLGAKVVTFPQMVKLIESGVIAGYNHDVHNDGGGGQVQIRMKAKKALLFGHLDQLIIFESGEIASMEVKALGPDLWKSWCSNKKVEAWLAKALDGKYAWQVSGQMTTGLPCILVAGQKIEDGTDVGEVQWRRLDEPPYSKKEVKARIAEAMVHVNAGTIPACDEGRYGCPYFGFTFHESKKDETKWLLDEKYAELLKYVRLRATARDDRNAAQEEYDEAGKNIEALIAALELDPSKKYGFEDDAHNKFTMRWISKEMPERDVHYDASTQSYPDVRLVKEKA
jgi:hypothetical protein